MRGDGAGRASSRVRSGDPDRSVRRGFTLVEVLVGLVVLELGMLGVAGLVTLSGRLLGEAALLERIAYAAEEAADSLAGASAVRSGRRSVSGGRIRWEAVRRGPDGLFLFRIVAEDERGVPAAVLRVLLRGRPAPEPGRAGAGGAG